jgi:hypothetical protein
MSSNDERAMPPFEEAIKQFQNFIEEQGGSPDLLWVFREDCGWWKRRLFVRMSPRLRDADQFRARYERGVARGLGVQFIVLCSLAGSSCCFLWTPRDEMDAEYAMIAGLKLSVPMAPERAYAIRNPLLWRILGPLIAAEPLIFEMLPLRAGTE